MKIVVLVKQVPDSGTERTLRSDDNTVDRASASNVINEMDEYAIEEALKLREAHGGEVTILTMGPDRATESIRKASGRDMGDGQTLADKQVIQHWIAESRAEINAARYMVLHAANKMDLQGAKAAKNEISAIKFFVADILMKVLDRAIQCHGALGMTDDTVLSFWYRHERGARIYDGPDEVHKSALAKSILRSYKTT